MLRENFMSDQPADEVVVARAGERDLGEIVALLNDNEAPRGSLTGHFTRERIDASIREMPVMIARLGGRLVGALVSSPIALVRNRPVLAQMLAVYPGGPNAYVYGPLCVAAAARGLGVARMLYERLRAALPGREGILFIRQDNGPSLRAHQRLAGMQVRGDFTADGVSFVVLSFVA
jgi:hypothetical protein